MLDSIFLQISVLLGITVSIAFVMRLLRQPLMTAYLVAGIVAGPFFLNLLNGDTELFEAFAEFGVVLLLFVVGLSLSFDHIKRIGKVAFTVGTVQFVFTAVFGYFLLQLLNFSQTTSIYLALAMTFSSTIVIVKLLNDKKHTDSVYGRYALGLMVVQDIIALFLLIFLTSFTGEQSAAQIGAELFVKIVLLISLVYFLSRFVAPKILNKVASSTEFLFIFTVAWCFGVASLLHWIGFSVEVGALIAGLTLGSSPYQAEISSRVKPLRDFFLVLFFIILGSQLSLSNIDTVLIPGIILSLFIIIGNPFILYWAFRFFKFTRRNSLFAGIIAGQVSEFGFILLLTGKQLGHIQGVELEIFTLVALITIVISSYAITHNEKVFKLLSPVLNVFGPDNYKQKEDKIKKYDVWVFGYHRIGWKVCEALKAKGRSFVVVDYDPHALDQLKARGIAAYYGDAGDVDFLEELPLDTAKMIISTLPEEEDQKTLIQYVRKYNKKAIIVGNLYDIERRKELYKAGADYVMMPHLLGGNWISEILKTKKWTKKTFESLHKEQNHEMKQRFAPVKTHDD